MDRLLATSPLMLGVVLSFGAGDPVRAPRPTPSDCLDCRLIEPVPSRTSASGPKLSPAERMPKRLPQTDEVVPLPSSGMKPGSSATTLMTNPALTDLVEKQLSNLTDAQQKIWIEELRGLPLGIAREMLLARERAGGGVALESGRIFESNQKAEELIPRRPEQGTPRSPNAAHPDAVERSLKILRRAEAVILNNIANANTIGFKRRIPFTTAAPYGLSDLTTGRTQTQGPLVKTGRPLDLALEGPGFFQVERNGTIALTRAGQFHLNKGGTIVTTIDGQRWFLHPRINVPVGSVELIVSSDGNIHSRSQPGEPPASLGRIQLVLPSKFSQLKRTAPGLWSIPKDNARWRTGTPQQPGFATIRAGYLESSNVKLRQALAALNKVRQQREALKSALRKN